MPCDLSKPAHIFEAVQKIVDTLGCIDVLVNNASAHYSTGIEALDEKRFGVMNDLNVRGTFFLTRDAIPHMKASVLPHVLTVAPAPIADRTWIAPTPCYTNSKIAMGMLTAAWSVEFPHIHFNAIWPQRVVATFAVTNTFQLDIRKAVTVAHVADPAYRIVTSESRTRFYKDADVLMDMGVTDFSAWKVDPREDVYDDFMVEAVGLKEGQHVGYVPLPPATASRSMSGRHVLLVGAGDTVAGMHAQLKDAGASATRVELTAHLKDMDRIMEEVDGLDDMFINAGPMSSVGTLDTTLDAWDDLFALHCKAPNFIVVKALPALRRTDEQSRVVIAAQAPTCHPEALASPAVPCAVVSQLRGMYVIGINQEFGGPAMAVNAIWDHHSPNRNPTPEASLRLHQCEDVGMGNFYEVDLEALPEIVTMVGYEEYATGTPFKDVTTSMWLSSVLRDTSLAEFVAVTERIVPTLRIERKNATDYVTTMGMTGEQIDQFFQSVWLGPIAPAPAPLTHFAYEMVTADEGAVATVTVRLTAACALLPGAVATAVRLLL